MIMETLQTQAMAAPSVVISAQTTDQISVFRPTWFFSVELNNSFQGQGLNYLL